MSSFGVFNETLCGASIIPSVSEYFNASFYGYLAFSVGGIGLVLVAFLFIDTIKYVLNKGPAQIKTYTFWVLVIYPLTYFLYYLALIVPRAYALCEAVVQLMLMAAFYQLFCLFQTYCNGETQLIKKVGAVTLKLNTPPLCCCCFCLPTFTVKKRTLKSLKWQVLQVPIILGVVYSLFIVLSSESEELYNKLYWYLTAIIIGSSFLGLWGLNMIMTLLSDSMDPEFKFTPKLRVLEIVLPMTQLQGLATSLLLQNNVYPCNPPLTPRLYATLVLNSIILLEMTVLAFIARRLYKRELPDLIAPEGVINKGPPKL